MWTACKKNLLMGAAAGLAAGAAIGFAATQAARSPMEKMVCGHIRKARRTLCQWMAHLGV